MPHSPIFLLTIKVHLSGAGSVKSVYLPAGTFLPPTPTSTLGTKDVRVVRPGAPNLAVGNQAAENFAPAPAWAGIVHRNRLAVRKFARGLGRRTGKLGFARNHSRGQRRDGNAQKYADFHHAPHSVSISLGLDAFYAILVNASLFTIHFFDANKKDC